MGLFPPPKAAIERIQPFPYEQNSLQFKSFQPIASKYVQIPDNFELTNKQINNLDQLAQQVINNSITVDEAILQLRGGDGMLARYNRCCTFYSFSTIRWLC